MTAEHPLDAPTAPGGLDAAGADRDTRWADVLAVLRGMRADLGEHIARGAGRTSTAGTAPAGRQEGP